MCRFRAFTVSVSQLYSAWLLVLITMDRWIRVRFALRSNTLCTPKKALSIALIVLLFVITFHVHLLFFFYGSLLPGLPHVACGANGLNVDYAIFYYYHWLVIRVSEEHFFDEKRIQVKIVLVVLILLFFSS